MSTRKCALGSLAAMATAVRRGMRLGIIEPHLGCFGGIRRMIEFANRLSARGHDVTFFLPDGSDLSCNWMRCDARIAPMTSGFDTPLDVVIFNSEPQWHLVERFQGARRRVFYALHYACLYDKEGSWESLRTPVDLQLANSNWTADQILNETGYRPVVQLGGVNRETFRPASMKRNIPLLTNGEKHRSWKGTDTVLEAARLANVHLSTYAGKNLDQSELGRRYARAQVFAVGSWFEGFCQPGLEALACGTPLVTTDNGGCREYARDGETALVVAPRDAAGMADAIRRLRDDTSFAQQLTSNGLDLVARDFDWEARTDEFASVLDGVVAGKAAAPPTAPSRSEKPALSIIVQGSDDLRQTQLFMESVRRATDVPYDVVLVDSSTDWEAENYAVLRGRSRRAGRGGSRVFERDECGRSRGHGAATCVLQHFDGVHSRLGAARCRRGPLAQAGRDRDSGTRERRDLCTAAVFGGAAARALRRARRRLPGSRTLERQVRNRDHCAARTLLRELGPRSRRRCRARRHQTRTSQYRRAPSTHRR